MIRIESIDHIPTLPWAPLSAAEFEVYSEELLDQLARRSLVMAMVLEDEQPLAVAGLYAPSLLGECWFWALFTEALLQARLSSFRAMRSALDLRVPRAVTLVEDGIEVTRRWAKFFNFQPTDINTLVQGKSYTLYRRG